TVVPDEGRALALSAQPVPLYHGDTGRVLDDLKRWTGDGWRVALVFAGHGPAQRSVEVLRDAGFGVSLVDSVASPPPPGSPVVPTDQLDQLSRYVGGEAPALHKLGGSDWAKSKARARKAVREIAAQLIQLYAARQNSKGYAFGPDTPWQRELEDAFPYTETPD